MPPRRAPKRKAVESAAVEAKRARGETDLDYGLDNWAEDGDMGAGKNAVLYLASSTEPGATKVAAFDIDFTVITTKSGRKFATNAADWDWWHESVPDKLRTLYNDEGYKLAFFTNQAGIEKGKTNPREIRTKIEAIIKKLGVPVHAFVSTGTTHFRKPSTVIWEYMEGLNQGVKVDRAQSVYVGDAAGRPKEWAPGKPRDFSCSDRMFAANLGVPFYTPEEYFLDEAPAPFDWGTPDPETYIAGAEGTSLEDSYHSETPELVVMVGVPASGKSTFCRRFFAPHGYVVVNRDTLKTPAKCIKVAQESVKAGKSVVVDNTNPGREARGDYIAIAKKAKIPCRCFYVRSNKQVAQHMNFMRMTMTNGEVRRIPDVAYAVYNKGFVAPTTAEGFTEVQTIDFVPYFENKKHETLFKQWTTPGH